MDVDPLCLDFGRFLGEVELLAGDPLVHLKHVFDRRLKMARGIVALGDETLVSGALRYIHIRLTSIQELKPSKLSS